MFLSHINVSLPLFLSSFCSLSKNKQIKSLKKEIKIVKLTEKNNPIRARELLKLSSKFDFELPSSQGKKGRYGQLHQCWCQRRKPTSSSGEIQLSVGRGAQRWGDWYPQRPIPLYALTNSPRQLLMPLAGES